MIQVIERFSLPQRAEVLSEASIPIDASSEQKHGILPQALVRFDSISAQFQIVHTLSDGSRIVLHSSKNYLDPDMQKCISDLEANYLETLTETIWRQIFLQLLPSEREWRGLGSEEIEISFKSVDGTERRILLKNEGNDFIVRNAVSPLGNLLIRHKSYDQAESALKREFESVFQIRESIPSEDEWRQFGWDEKFGVLQRIIQLSPDVVSRTGRNEKRKTIHLHHKVATKIGQAEHDVFGVSWYYGGSGPMVTQEFKTYEEALQQIENICSPDWP